MSFMLPKSMDRPTGSQGKIPPRRAKQGQIIALHFPKVFDFFDINKTGHGHQNDGGKDGFGQKGKGRRGDPPPKS